MIVAELFEVVGLTPCGPVPWMTKIFEPRAGVYVISLVADANLSSQVCADYLPESDLDCLGRFLTTMLHAETDSK
jgi:hypothetical protein